jgi:hypothetical protein
LPEWILGRQHYHVRRFDLSALPRSSRAQALDLQLRQWVPYAQPGYRALWANGIATVFCWDTPFVQAAMAEQGLNAARTRILPETMLRSPGTDDIRLVECLQGYEGQIWQEGQLLATRYWRQRPDNPSWFLFQRDLSDDHSRMLPQVPTATTLPLLDKPWKARHQTNALAWDVWRNEKWLYFAIMLVALPVITWHLSQLAGYIATNQALEQTLQDVQVQVAPFAQARGKALTAIVASQRLLDLDPYPSQLQLMAWMAENLLKKGDQLSEWDYQQGGKLRITLDTAIESKATALVEILNKAAWFQDIRATPGNKPNRVSLEMTLQPLGQPKGKPHVG